MQFLGMFRHVRTAHAQGLTGGMFVSLGNSALSARDVYAEGGLMVFASGQMENREQLENTLKLDADASLSMIVTRAYRKWGADYPRHLTGPVATGVIDRAEDRMILSTDRAGAKGVYYSWRGRSAAFASHPALLLQAGAAGRGVNGEGIAEMFAFGGLYSPGRTPYKDIRVLEPGCVLVADARGTRIKRYYSIWKELMKPDDVPVNERAREWLCGLPRGDTGLVLPADALFDAGNLFLHPMEGVFFYAEREGDAPVPVETVFQDAAQAGEKLRQAALYTGLPGDGAWDMGMLSALENVRETCSVAAAWPDKTDAAAAFSGEDMCRFLRPEVMKKANVREYASDRINEIMDRIHAPLSENDAEDGLKRAAYALCAIQTRLLRLSLMGSAVGVKCLSPLSDPAVLLAVIRQAAKEKRTAPAPKELAESSALSVISEACALTEDTSQPVHEIADRKMILKEIRKDVPDVRALARLIEINAFLSQNEAEALLF